MILALLLKEYILSFPSPTNSGQDQPLDTLTFSPQKVDGDKGKVGAKKAISRQLWTNPRHFGREEK
jgi:hypothetical protein